MTARLLRLQGAAVIYIGPDPSRDTVLVVFSRKGRHGSWLYRKLFDALLLALRRNAKKLKLVIFLNGCRHRLEIFPGLFEVVAGVLRFSINHCARLISNPRN